MTAMGSATGLEVSPGYQTNLVRGLIPLLKRQSVQDVAYEPLGDLGKQTNRIA